MGILFITICLVGCISATNNSDIEDIESTSQTTNTQQQPINIPTNTQTQENKMQAPESKDPIVANDVKQDIKSDITTQTTNTTKTLKSNTTTNSKTVKQATKSQTKTTLKDISSYPGKTIQLTATVKSDKKVNTGEVVFKINGKTMGKSKISNGVATFKYTIPASFKNPTYTITAVYAENNIFKRSTVNATLYLKNVTKTKVTVTDITTYPGKKVTLKATVTAGNKVVKDGKVAVKINGKTIGHANVKNGVATFTYTIPSSLNKAKNSITFVYGEHNEFKESRANGTLFLKNVTKTNIKISVDNNIYQGDKIQIKATITSSKTVPSGKVAFKINGKTIGHANVKNGVVTFTYTVPSTYKGTYTINVVFGQTGEFKESRANSQIEVKTQKYKEYLGATNHCAANSAYFKSIVKDVTAKISGTYNKAVALFNYANKRLRYSGYYNTRYGSTQTCKQAYGNCCDMAHVVIALMRTAGIPARYNHATCYFNSGLVTGHVWAEVYVNGVWYKCDTTSAKNSFGVIKNWYKCGTIRKYRELPF